MYIDERKFYQIVYSMRTTLSDIYGIAEKMYKSDSESDKEIFLEKIKESILNFPEIQPLESENEKFVGDISDLRMTDTRVLVIDNSGTSNYVMQNILGDFGVHVDVALNSHDGIEKFKNNRYDIIFMDYVMPGMNGIDTAKKIRSMKNGKEQLIIGLTASMVPEFREGLNSLGIELMLFKPVKKEQIGFILSKELPHKAVFDFTSEFL
ncbi:MAG: response regulator [Lachnospiraceae bacterium]|nr:response regulator [Lachnospiraceae bacterium]